MTPELLYIVDGHALIHRAYHAPFKTLSGPEGSCPSCGVGSGNFDGDPSSCPTCNGSRREPTKATYLYTRNLLGVVKRRKPDYLVVCGDGPRKKLKRRKLYPAYKGNRPSTPDDLRVQIGRCKQITKSLGIPLLQVDGYEADDLIATLARRYASDSVHVRIVGRDKDLVPLLADARVRLYDPADDGEFDGLWALAHYGVRADQMADFLAMTGDSSDNIPGVKGVGGKGATELLESFGSLDMIVNRARRGLLPLPRYNKAVMSAVNDGSMALSRRLVELDDQAPVTLPPSARSGGVDVKAASVIFRGLGFTKWD